MAAPHGASAQSTDRNYVKETLYLDSTGTAITTVSYYDGTRNHVETATTASGTGGTVYTRTTYDGKGRENGAA